MQGQTIITTHDVDELFISTVIRLIQRRAFPNLRNIIAKTHSADIAHWFPHLRTEAKASLFKVLIEEKRMGEVLRDLNSADISEFVEETDPSVVASILHTMPADDVTRILSDGFSPNWRTEQALKPDRFSKNHRETKWNDDQSP